MPHKRKRVDIVYCITFTYFNDDFKPRGENWSRNSGPYIFKDKTLADTFLRCRLMKWCCKRLDEFEKGVDEWKTMYRHALESNDLADAEELAAKISKGTAEYIQRIFDWSYVAKSFFDFNSKKCKIDTKLPLLYEDQIR